MLKVKEKTPQIFAIYNDEVEGRIDPFFHRLEFIEIENKLKKIKYKYLEDICKDIKNGSTPSGGNFDNSGIPYFRSQDFGLFDFKLNQFINKEFHNKIKRSSIKYGDVLLAVVGATLGVVGYVPKEIAEGNINQNVARLRVRSKNVDSKYLAIFLSSIYGQKQIQRYATVTTQAYLNNKQLGKIKIPLPSLPTQNKIVAIMSKAYEVKKRKEEKAEKLLSFIDSYVLRELEIKMPEIKNKMFFTVYSGEIKGRRIDPKAYLEKPKAILKAIQKSKYKSKKLSEIILGSIAGEWGKDPLFTDNTDDYILVNVLRNTNFDNEFNLNFESVAQRLITKDKFKKVKLQKDDILIEKSGGSPIQPVGRVAILDDDNEDFGFSNFLQCLKTDKKECLPHYLFSYLKTIYNLGYMEYVQNQTTGIKNLIMEEYLSIPILLPSLAIQNKIVKKVNAIYKESQTLQKEAKEVLENAKEKVEEMILK